MQFCCEFELQSNFNCVGNFTIEQRETIRWVQVGTLDTNTRSYFTTIKVTKCRFLNCACFQNIRVAGDNQRSYEGNRQTLYWKAPWPLAPGAPSCCEVTAPPLHHPDAPNHTIYILYTVRWQSVWCEQKYRDVFATSFIRTNTCALELICQTAAVPLVKSEPLLCLFFRSHKSPSVPSTSITAESHTFQFVEWEEDKG